MTSRFATNTNGIFAKLEDGTGYNSIYDTNVTNPYVNFFYHQNTQNLQDALVAEAVQMRGVEMIYIRRTISTGVDLLFGEDPLSKFTEHFKIAIYIESFDGWQGAQDWVSKFGFMVEDELDLAINPSLFLRQGDGVAPKPGDLLFFPQANSLFELTWIEHESVWYSLGTIPMRKIKARKFVYSGEEINLQDPNNTIDDIEMMFQNGHDTLAQINSINQRYDTDTVQGAQQAVMKEEAIPFMEGYTTVPPYMGSHGSPPVSSNQVQRNLTVDLNGSIEL